MSRRAGERVPPQPNGVGPDESPPPAASRRWIESFLVHWQHLVRDGETHVILHITPAASMPELGVVKDGEGIAIVFGADGWGEFVRDVDRGGHKSPVTIAKVAP